MHINIHRGTDPLAISSGVRNEDDGRALRTSAFVAITGMKVGRMHYEAGDGDLHTLEFMTPATHPHCLELAAALSDAAYRLRQIAKTINEESGK